jgi:chitinase
MGYLSQSEINAFIASRPAGKNALVVISDGVAGSSFANATTSANLSNFVNSIVSFVAANGYDGVDLDWESNVNVSQFVALLSALRTAMPDKIIAMDVGNWANLPSVAASGYQYTNQINVMCYDMDYGSPYTWHNDALFQNGDTSKMTCDWRMRAFQSAGVPNSKLGVGIPFYGRLWSGTVAPLQTGGSVSSTVYYRDVAVKYLSSFTPHWDATYSADYLSNSSTHQFISYNGSRSIQAAVNWMNSQGFGGMMAFTTEYEYISGASGDSRYPLSSALCNAVFGSCPAGP